MFCNMYICVNVPKLEGAQELVLDVYAFIYK